MKTWKIFVETWHDYMFASEIEKLHNAIHKLYDEVNGSPQLFWHVLWLLIIKILQ